MTSPRPLITLTTDFGSADGTVAAMIGVIESICPEAEVISVNSGVPPHDIVRGAWALFQSVPFFPGNAIHVGVVDPGVGSRRRAVMVTTEHGTLIGPDNGLLSWAVRDREHASWYQLENPSYRIAPFGLTFDGRDLFAPAAAYLAAGADPATFGPAISDRVILRWPQPRVVDEAIEGEILVVDQFGNLITNVPVALVAELCGGRSFQVVLPASRQITPGKHKTATDPAPFVRSYDDIRGRLGAVINGAGLVEIAARQGSASAYTGRARGDRVVVRMQGANT
jgi:S-adenosylmethionine hydrolase